MPLRLIEHPDPGEYYQTVLPFLLEAEAEYCTQIGLVMRMSEGVYAPISTDELPQPLLITVQNNKTVELAAIQTLKTTMIVTRGSADAIFCLVDGLAARNWMGNEIFGLSPSIAALASRYAERSRRIGRLRRRLRTMESTRVAWPLPAAGEMRLCTLADRHVLARFLGDFAAEIGEPGEEPDIARADRLIEGSRIFLWLDREPVAFAAWGGRTPNGVRVSSVYTPQPFRGRGYASNLVAHLTQRLLDEGRRFCFLHTDQANPTSNSIYQKIGYRWVCDSESWQFGDT